MSGGRGGESVNVSGGVSNAGLRSIHREEEESPHRDEPSVSCQFFSVWLKDGRSRQNDALFSESIYSSH
jgi:hypothetical protein